MENDRDHSDIKTPEASCAGGETQTSSTPSSGRDLKSAIKKESTSTAGKKFQLIVSGSQIWSCNATLALTPAGVEQKKPTLWVSKEEVTRHRQYRQVKATRLSPIATSKTTRLSPTATIKTMKPYLMGWLKSLKWTLSQSLRTIG